MPSSLIYLPARIDNISVADVVYTPIPTGARGEIIEIRAVMDAARATAAENLSFHILPSGTPYASILVSNGGNPGDPFVTNPANNRSVVPGDVISVTTLGASTAPCVATITYVIML